MVLFAPWSNDSTDLRNNADPPKAVPGLRAVCYSRDILKFSSLVYSVRQTPRIHVKELYLPEDGFSLKLHQVFSSEIIMIQRLVEWFGANVFIGREKIIGPFCQYWMWSLSQLFLIFLQNDFSSLKDVFIIQFL